MGPSRYPSRLSGQRQGLPITISGPSTRHTMISPTAPYDTAFASTATLKPAIFNTDNELKALEGTPANESSYTLWDMGQDHTPILFKRIRPRFKKAPTSGSHFHAYRDVLGEDDISSGERLFRAVRSIMSKRLGGIKFATPIPGIWRFWELMLSSKAGAKSEPCPRRP